MRTIRSNLGFAKHKLGRWVILTGLLCVAPVGEVLTAEPCEPWAAKIVSIEGRVEASHIGEPRWVPARLKQIFCPGDRVRIESRSRAAVLLPNQTVLRLDEGTALTFTQVMPAEPSLLDLLKGAIHFLSRTPAQLRINTPFSAAGVEGTEFVLRVTENATQLWVFEGRVRFANAKGSLMLASGEAAAAQAGRAPQRRVVVRPREAVQWALYYPPLIDSRLSSYPAGPDALGIREALRFYRHDDLRSAFASLDTVPEEARDASYYALTAGLLLNVGRVDEARADLDQALKLDPENATAYALQSVIALVQNQQEQALYLARKAEELDPKSPIPKVALSYAHQAKFDIEKALENIEQAIALAPTDALAYARLAELQLSRGDLERAVTAAKTAVALDPDLARTQAVLGFAYLTEIDIDRAKATFQKAIELDPASPLPRLGLGLAKIRDGDLREGTQEIEIAASLDPNNSLVRSYLGKAYFEEKRGGLASSEFEIAKALDPNDPTPWFYDAIHKQTTNRPVEALHDLQKAIELNDNRAVYRSKLLLDEDVAARSVNLARIYDDLRFEQRARLEAWKSTTIDPTNFSAHRFLADAYATLQRHEIARVSELLQSQLLQPANISPLQPEIAETNLAILEGTGPSSVSFNEFNPLFTRDGAALQTNALIGNNGTAADDLALSFIHGSFSASFGQFHYETNGFSGNRDLTHDVYNALGQWSPVPKLSLQAELRRRETESGDVALKLLGNDPDLRQNIVQDSARLGAHYTLAPRQHVLGSFIYQDAEFDTNDLNLPRTSRINLSHPVNGYGLELQHLYRGEWINTTLGIGYVSLDEEISSSRDLLSTAGRVIRTIPGQKTGDTPEEINGYMYVPIKLSSSANMTLGASYDSFHQFGANKHRLNPKFGLLWNPMLSTVFRVAAFRVLKRLFLANQTLEPTHLAGFNQFFDDSSGSDSLRYGAAVDQRLSRDLYAGLEVTWRDLDRVILVRNDAPEVDQDESLHRAYVYWAPTETLALGAEYRFEEFERKPIVFNGQRLPSVTEPDELRTHHVPLSLNYHHPEGVFFFFASLGLGYVHQLVQFKRTAPAGELREQDSFWVVDASVGYRLPKRYGLIGIDLRNLLDEDFMFQGSFDTAEPRAPQFQPERAIVARLNLWFD